jgi:hypothetical protein
MLETVRNALAASWKKADILARLNRDFGHVHRVSLMRVEDFMREVRARWAEEDVAERVTWKSSEIRKLERSVAQLEDLIAAELTATQELRLAQQRGERLGEKRRSPEALYATKLQYHRVLADIKGLNAPLQLEVSVDVAVHQRVQVAIAALTSDEVSEIVSASRKMEELAEAYKREHVLVEGTAQ